MKNTSAVAASSYKQQNAWIIEVASDLAVIGYNPENADLDNPRGEIIAEIFYLQATNGRGDRVYFGEFHSFEAAEAALDLAPSVSTWELGRPEYGSLAWQEYGEANQMAAEAREAEAERWGFVNRFEAY